MEGGICVQNKYFVNILYWVVFLIFVFICWAYSFGALDTFLMKYVEYKEYELGNFTYTGNIIDGRFQNKGTITIGNRAQYIGEFNKGKFEGFFTYSDNDNFRIHGVYVDNNIISGGINIRSGKISIIEDNEIIYKIDNGCEYKGKIGINGQYGFGSFTYKDGAKYEGNFTKGLANKEGTYSFGDISYEGNFSDGLFDGFGKYKCNSLEYKGEFKCGLPDGRGIYISKDGWKYEGNFTKGVFNGEGVVIDINGNTTKGLWDEGRRVM